MTTDTDETGWVHQSAWTAAAYSLSSAAGGPGGTAPRDEIEIGGRG